MKFQAFVIISFVMAVHSTGNSMTCEKAFLGTESTQTMTIEEFTSEISTICDQAQSLFTNNGEFKLSSDPYDHHGTIARNRIEAFSNFIDAVYDLRRINDQFLERLQIATSRDHQIYLKRVADTVLKIKLTIFEDLPYINQDIIPYTDRKRHQQLIDNYDNKLVDLAEYAMVETGYSLSPLVDYRLRQDFQAFNNPPKVTYPVFKPNKKLIY